MEGSRLGQSDKADPDGIDELAAGLLALAGDLAGLRPGPIAATGAGPLDRALGELCSALDRGLVELGSSLGGHGWPVVGASGQVEAGQTVDR